MGTVRTVFSEDRRSIATIKRVDSVRNVNTILIRFVRQAAFKNCFSENFVPFE